jgi:AcrR family transcriptional regulator
LVVIAVKVGDDRQDRELGLAPCLQGGSTTSSTAPVELRQLVVERLRAREAEIWEAIFTHLRTEIPDPVGLADAEYMAGLRDAVGAGLDYMLTGIELGRPRTGAHAPAAALRQARRAARAGVGIDIVLSRYMAGHTLLGQYVMRELAQPDLAEEGIAPNALLGASAKLLGASGSLLGRLTTPVRDAYREEIARARRTRPHPTITQALPQPQQQRHAARSQNVPTSLATPARSTPTQPTPRTGLWQDPAAGRRHDGDGTESGPRHDPSSGPRHDPAGGSPYDSMTCVSADAAVKPRPRTSAAQRARIVWAATEVFAERGYGDTTVEKVINRGQVSYRTFSNCFPGGLEECMIAIMDSALIKLGAIATRALAQEQDWCDAVRMALAGVLAFFDNEPALTRVCISESLAASPPVRRHREAVTEAFRELIFARIKREVPDASPLATEAVMASVMGIINTRLTTGQTEPMITLLGPLMARVVTPFVTDQRITREEIRRSHRLSRAIQAGEIDLDLTPPPADAAAEQEDGELPAMVIHPNAHRVRDCLRSMAAHPDTCNREIATSIGISHQSQISKLLSDLARAGLATKRSYGAGKRTTWRLTPYGEQVVHALTEHEVEGFGG